MRQQKNVVVALAVLLALLPGRSLAQSFSTPDDRYTGYLRTLVAWPTALPDLKTCVAQEYYEPLDTHLMRYVNRVKVAGTRTQEHDECTWMLTRNKWRWVLRPKGTKVAIDAAGRDLFDYGSPKGKECGNPRPVSVAVKPEPVVVKEEPIVVPPEPTPVPAPVIQPPPAPGEILVVKQFRKAKSGERISPPRDFTASVTFLAHDEEREKRAAERIQGRVKLFREGDLYIGRLKVPAATYHTVLSEMESGRLTLAGERTQTVDVRPGETARIDYVNFRRGRDICGPWAWRCWVPPLVAGGVYAVTRDRDRDRARIDREPTKGSGGDGKPPVTNPGGSP